MKFVVSIVIMVVIKSVVYSAHVILTSDNRFYGFVFSNLFYDGYYISILISLLNIEN